jgi:CMP-2-keto-3-deoxyoctulosonic acid synthetase
MEILEQLAVVWNGKKVEMLMVVCYESAEIESYLVLGVS